MSGYFNKIIFIRFALRVWDLTWLFAVSFNCSIFLTLILVFKDFLMLSHWPSDLSFYDPSTHWASAAVFILTNSQTPFSWGGTPGFCFLFFVFCHFKCSEAQTKCNFPFLWKCTFILHSLCSFLQWCFFAPIKEGQELCHFLTCPFPNFWYTIRHWLLDPNI